MAAYASAAASPASENAILRYADPPVVVSTSAGREWRASLDCAPPVSLAALIGARVGFAYDFDLDGVADAADSLGISPADCGGDREDGESAPGRIALRRRLPAAAQGEAAVLRADLLFAAPDSGDTAARVADSRVTLTAGAGSMLRLVRYCARPKNGEPEWVEVRNVSARTLPLALVRLEGRALALAGNGALAPGESLVAGSDTAELRLWQPGVRAVALSSWSNLRNSGDTLRLSFADADPAAVLMLDSVVYGPAADPSEGCASLASEGSSAAAAGYALEFSASRWSRAKSSGRATPFTVTVRAPADGRYDLLAYDLDGRPLCALARDAAGPASHVLPAASCPALDRVRAGRVILHLSPRHAPGVRTLLRVAP